MVIWSIPAKTDLTHIFEYIAHDSKHYAKKVIQEIVEKIDFIAIQPHIGHVVSEIANKNVREFPLYSSRITDSNITILTIAHKRKLFKSNDVK